MARIRAILPGSGAGGPEEEARLAQVQWASEHADAVGDALAAALS
jgi:hypothetical protein